jgi:P pilus assembly chaperone PapD
VVVNLTGTGVAQTQTVAVTPTTLVFDPQVTGTTSNQQTVTVTNTGNFQVTFTNVTVSSNYALSNGCTGILAPASSCQIGVTFTPTAVGNKNGTLTITDSAKPSPQTVALSGTGISTSTEIQLSQTTVTFDAQTVSTTSPPQAVYYSNQGNTTITISSITQTGTEFSLSGSSCQNGTQVTAGTSCLFRITFTPSAPGARTSTVTITDNAPGSPRKITLNGTGITSSAPEVNLTPATLTFAAQAVGTTSAAQNLNLTNNGDANLAISNITITGTNSGDFAQTNNCVSPLLPGFSCNIALTFSPTATGTRAATLSVTDSASGSPHAAALTGTGKTGSLPVVTLNPTSLAFPNVPLNTLSQQAVTVKNTGTSALTISNITITGTVPTNWTQSNTCTGSIAVNGTCTITVSFTPTTVADQTATVSLTDNAGNSPQSLPITGNGALAAVLLSPTSINFGSQKSGTTSSPQTITVENYGNATLNLTSIIATGPFAISNNTCGTTLAIGAICSVSVEFKPTQTGAASGSVAFTDNAGGSPQIVTLSGTGT